MSHSYDGLLSYRSLNAERLEKKIEKLNLV